jgi:tetratricopeptide (TPR) repeat protein
MLAAAVRPTFAVCCLFAACASPIALPPAPLAEAPDAYVSSVAAWLPGHPVAAGLAAGAPDAAPWRAMAVWWREALRQSAHLRVDDFGTPADRLELAIDPVARTATATWRRGSATTLLAACDIRDGDVPAAIDRLARAARAAVGDESPAAVPCATGTSARHEVVDACSDALSLLRDGGFASARRILRDGRRRDARAPWLLEPLAACEAALGDAAAALRLCDEALAEPQRLLPTTRHRLQRTRLLAQAALTPDDAARCDAELLALAVADRAARPFDAEPLRSAATAHALRGEFAAALPLLDELLAHDPQAASARQLAGCARLALGEPATAADHFTAIGGRLPASVTLLPHATALFDAGRRAECRALVDRAVEEAASERSPFEVDARQMRAALLLADGDDSGLRAELRAILGWFVARPATLAARAVEFVAEAALLGERGDFAEVDRLLDLAAVTAAGPMLATAADDLRRAAAAGELAARRARTPDRTLRLRGPWHPPLRGPEWMAAQPR